MTRGFPAEIVERYVASADGTPIAYRRFGTGPPVVVAHGALGDAASWWEVARRLADRFEFFLMDRRNRGGSGKGNGPHSMEREVGDIRAVVQLTGTGADLIGHSYGAVVALEAALRAQPGEIGRLLLYEPGLRSAQGATGGDIEKLRSLVALGSLEDTLVFFLERMSSLRPSEIEAARESTGWRALVARAATLPDEVAAVQGLPFDLERYRRIDLPTLLVIGELSGESHDRNLQSLLAVLPDARVARLANEGHIATVTAPDVLAAVVGEFLGHTTEP